MKTLFKISVLLVLAFLPASCFMQKKLTVPDLVISQMTDTSRIRESSVVYALPRSVFTIKVSFERTIEIPGPYARYAGDLLGLDNVIRNEQEFWSINGISVESHQEADPSGYYVINTGQIFSSNVLSLKNEGLILDLNPEVGSRNEVPMNTRESDLDYFRSFDLGSDEYFLIQRDTAFRRVSMDSTFIRIPYLVEKKKRLPAEQLAERAAKRLMDLRDGKMMILTGEANVFPQDKTAIEEINRIEREYTELFTGKIFREERTFTYQVVPDKNMQGKPVALFKFSETTGPGEVTSKEGTTVNIILTPEQKTKEITIASGNQAAPSSVSALSDKLFYRIPDVVNLKIILGNEILYNSRRLIYQFGEVMQLPANYLIGR